MRLCVGKTNDGNFLVCHVKKIVLNSRLDTFFFIGDTEELFFIETVGVFEAEILNSKFSSFHYSSLLSPHSLLESSMKSHPVYLTKYAPYDPCL